MTRGILVVLLSIGVSTVAVLLRVGLTQRPSSTSLILESPQKTYTVRIDERSGSDGAKDVILNASKYGQPFLENVIYSRGTSLDGSFLRRYPQREWVSESILRFGSNSIDTQTSDEFTIVDELSSPLKFLTLNTPSESFLFLSVRPGETVQVNAEPQSALTADISSVACLATLMDGTTRKASANFNIRGHHAGAAHYKVVITESALVVQSSEFQLIGN